MKISVHGCLSVFATLLMMPMALAAGDAKQPNIVLFFIDDMGYADITPFGAKGYDTPNLSRMANEGRIFTDFVVSSAVCSASRAALLTGCIHERVGFRGALGPDAKMGIAQSETTLGELCQSKSYATACFGKWHLGHHTKFLPTQHGFDRYYGLPYSNDMWPQHPASLAAIAKDPTRKPFYPPLPMIEGSKIVDGDVSGEDQKQLTREYTRRAVQFIRENQSKPFLLYLPHSMVHVPLFSSSDFEGKHPHGPYADAVQEIDWSVGQILETLEQLKLDDKTLIIFTTDNGPWLSYGSHAGSAGPLREGKGTAWEGGVRVPTVMRWKGKIPAGTQCHSLASTIDILPTVAELIEAKLPPRPLDGKSIATLMTSDDAVTPHESIPYYYANGQLQAIRDERWKLVFPHEYRSFEGLQGRNDGKPVEYATRKVESLELYDLDNDVGERTNVIAEHPSEAKRLGELADKWRQSLGDSLQKIVGKDVRPADKLE
jgi:arylsulfatase A